MRNSFVFIFLLIAWKLKITSFLQEYEWKITELLCVNILNNRNGQYYMVKAHGLQATMRTHNVELTSIQR